MNINDLRSDATMIELFATMDAKDNTKAHYLQAMAKYTELTGKTPEELLDDAESEIENGTKMRKRNIKKYLIEFREYLKNQGLADRTVRGHMSDIKNFYQYFEIDIPKMVFKNNGKANVLESNKKIPTRDDIEKILDKASTRNKAIVLVQASSGMGQAEILNLKVGQFLDGHDKRTGITTLFVRRVKVEYDYITFLSPEASEAVQDYIDYRNRIPKMRGKQRGIVHNKRKINSNDDYLFIKDDVPAKYLTTFDEKDRKLNPQGLMDAYRVLAERVGKDTKKGDWQFIRSHTMRKYFNNTLVNEGVDMFFVDFLMGHTVDSTHDAYFKADPEKLKKRYMKYLPYIAIENTESRVVSDAAYEELKSRYEEQTKNNEEMRKRVEKLEKHHAMTKDIAEIKEIYGDVAPELIETLMVHADAVEEGIDNSDITYDEITENVNEELKKRKSIDVAEIVMQMEDED